MSGFVCGEKASAGATKGGKRPDESTAPGTQRQPEVESPHSVARSTAGVDGRMAAQCAAPHRCDNSGGQGGGRVSCDELDVGRTAPQGPDHRPAPGHAGPVRPQLATTPATCPTPLRRRQPTCRSPHVLVRCGKPLATTPVACLCSGTPPGRPVRAQVTASHTARIVAERPSPRPQG